MDLCRLEDRMTMVITLANLYHLLALMAVNLPPLSGLPTLFSTHRVGDMSITFYADEVAKKIANFD